MLNLSTYFVALKSSNVDIKVVLLYVIFFIFSIFFICMLIKLTKIILCKVKRLRHK